MRMGQKRASEILSELASKLTSSGTIPTFNLTTPFRNTIPIADEARMPGDLFLREKYVLIYQMECISNGIEG